ncbi:hypothetical protein EII18_09350 [Comamonadaceae bacterium OH3737_COT-264]|nr:hypothetical protein EII18_09350 [Comamonadaceae bacterium OH3737_COT-264]
MKTPLKNGWRYAAQTAATRIRQKARGKSAKAPDYRCKSPENCLPIPPCNRRTAAFAALVAQRLRCSSEGLLRFSIAAVFLVKTVHLRLLPRKTASQTQSQHPPA